MNETSVNPVGLREVSVPKIANGGEIVKFEPQKDVENAKIAAQALMQVIKLKPKPVMINGEQYLEFEDWQLIGTFFQYSAGIEWTRKLPSGYEAKAVLYNKDGVVVGGAEAMCTREEMNWKTKPEFQIRSMAQTRAMAKALRSKFGAVAVLAGYKPTPAEEMNDVLAKEAEKTFVTQSNSEINDEITSRQKVLIKQLMDKHKIKKLTDIGIEEPASLTKQWAHETIEKLLAYKK